MSGLRPRAVQRHRGQPHVGGKSGKSGRPGKSGMSSTTTATGAVNSLNIGDSCKPTSSTTASSGSWTNWRNEYQVQKTKKANQLYRRQGQVPELAGSKTGPISSSRPNVCSRDACVWLPGGHSVPLGVPPHRPYMTNGGQITMVGTNWQSMELKTLNDLKSRLRLWSRGNLMCSGRGHVKTSTCAHHSVPSHASSDWRYCKISQQMAPQRRCREAGGCRDTHASRPEPTDYQSLLPEIPKLVSSMVASP